MSDYAILKRRAGNGGKSDENGRVNRRKIKKEKSTAPGEWLYFAPANVTVRSIYEVLTDDYEVEIWEDAGVLEIGLNDGATLDIEWTKIPAKDEITAAFAKQHGCENVFLVT